MYLHIGNDVIVKTESVVGVFDLETSTINNHTRVFLAKAEKSGQVINVSEEMPKSFIVCADNEDKTVYISHISSATLLKRVESLTAPGKTNMRKEWL